MIDVEARYQRNRHHGFGRGGRIPNKDKPRDGLSQLEERIYTTYRARLRTANRTRLRGQLWTLPLVVSPVVTLVVAIVGLAAPEIYSDRVEVLLVVLSVLTLVASIIVPSARYEANSERLFTAYRQLQRLAARVERENELRRSARHRARTALRADARYQEVLDATQNHSSADYWGVVRADNQVNKRAGLPQKQIPLSGWIAMVGSWSLTALPAALAVGLMPFAFPSMGWLLGR